MCVHVNRTSVHRESVCAYVTFSVATVVFWDLNPDTKHDTTACSNLHLPVCFSYRSSLIGPSSDIMPLEEEPDFDGPPSLDQRSLPSSPGMSVMGFGTFHFQLHFQFFQCVCVCVCALSVLFPCVCVCVCVCVVCVCM